MSRVWFDEELETVATWWRIFRKDGVTIGFTSHDRDMFFDDIRHLAAPGMVPSAIRFSADLEPDSAEMSGGLSHAAVTAEDLALGRFDGARIEMGLVDWQTLERETIFTGQIGTVDEDGGSFSAELLSEKSRLDLDTIPRTSPTCRARFCGPGCNLPATRFTLETTVKATSHDGARLSVQTEIDNADFLDGELRVISGSATGLVHEITAIANGMLVVSPALAGTVTAGTRIELREGCDHRWTTCRHRFGNAVNFRGEPFLPGNDLLARYPTAR